MPNKPKRWLTLFVALFNYPHFMHKKSPALEVQSQRRAFRSVSFDKGRNAAVGSRQPGNRVRATPARTAATLANGTRR
jgi:hypothetical protein